MLAAKTACWENVPGPAAHRGEALALLDDDFSSHKREKGSKLFTGELFIGELYMLGNSLSETARKVPV
jgi:hypothetical protein